ncbi:MAG: GNAT family N-acetyltransferase [Chloroflexota bacterium]
MLLPHNQRNQLAALLDTTSPADAPTAYYALYHDPKRSTLFIKTDEQHKAIGFVGRFQTGVDLFRPVLVLRCTQAEVAADLLEEALIVGRPYLLFSSLDQLTLVGGSLAVNNERVFSIYALDPAQFAPVVNVLVVQKTAPDGSPRAEIRSGDVQAVAGVNWQSPRFAEIYVSTDPEVRQRGWGKSVVTACTERILSSGRIPIYLVETSNEASVALAQSVGYYDTGARQVFADVVYMGHPAKGS